MNQASTAILIFSVSAPVEARRKAGAFREKAETTRKIADILIARTLREAHLSEIPVIHVSENQQTGNSFGERISNAFEKAFAAGYQRVMAIGNDCPGLSAQDLKMAAQALAKNEVVIGPARDGGAYLIGIDQKIFSPKVMASLSWQQNSLAKDLALYGDIFSDGAAFLRELVDIDDRQSLLQVCKEAPVDLVSTLIRRLLVEATIPLLTEQSLPANPLLFYRSNLRSPPLPNPKTNS